MVGQDRQLGLERPTGESLEWWIIVRMMHRGLEFDYTPLRGYLSNLKIKSISSHFSPGLAAGKGF